MSIAGGVGRAVARGAERAVVDGARMAVRQAAYGQRQNMTSGPPAVAQRQAALHAKAEARRAEQAARRAAADLDAADEDEPGAEVATVPPAALMKQEDRAALIIAETLRYTERILTRHCAWPSQAASDTAILWLIHANARDRDDTGMGPLIWRATPRLLLTSSQRGSGKSTALALLALLTNSRFGVLSKVTGPGFAKLMGRFQEAAFIDEARLVFGNGARSQELQGHILAGYSARSTALTGHAGQQEPEKVFGPVAYAGKDNLITEAGDSVQDILDRSIVIRMRRPSRHYPDIDETAEAAAQLAWKGMCTWTELKRSELLAAVRELSRQDCAAGELDAADVEAGILRARQIWRPLIAIADVIGGEWPQRARTACEELTQAAGSAETDDLISGLHALDAELFGDQDDAAADFDPGTYGEDDEEEDGQW